MRYYKNFFKLAVISWGVLLGGFENLTVKNIAYSQSALDSTFRIKVPRIIESVGLVEIQRKDTSKFVYAGEGTLLFDGDLVKLGSKAIARVLCSNGVIAPVNAGVNSSLSNICPSSTLVGGMTLPVLGEDDFLKYIDRRLYKLTLLDQKQVIRWQRNPQPWNGYRVQIGTSRETLLDEETSEPEIIYSGAKLLEQRREYTLIVKTSDDKKNTIVRADLRILLEKKKNELEQNLIIARSLKEISEVSKAIILADIYSEYDLSEQAIAELEKVTQSGKSLALIEQRLGNLSLQIGLKTKAESHFLKALILARKEKNFEAIAEAQVGIAKIFMLDSNKKEASAWLNNALKYYTKLGYNQKVEQIKSWLKKIQAAVSQDTSSEEIFAITSKLLVSKAEQIYKEEAKFEYLTPEAEKRVQLTLEIFTAEGDIKGQATILNYLALAKFHTQGLYKESLPLFQKALELYQKEPNNLAAQEIVFFNIGRSYRYLRNYQEALNFYQQALVISRKTNNCGGELDTLRWINIIYEIQEQDSKAREISKRIEILEKDRACLESSKILDPRTPIRGAW